MFRYLDPYVTISLALYLELVESSSTGRNYIDHLKD